MHEAASGKSDGGCRAACARRAVVAVSALLLSAPASPAQFLRLGPFDLAADATLDLIYSTNVEQERASDAKEAGHDTEDYYYVVGLDLNSLAAMAPSTTLTLDTGISVEQHANRPDLDNSSNPFGRLSLLSVSELGHYRFDGYGRVRREIDYHEDTYVPGGRTQRDVSDTWEYGLAAGWDRNSVRFAAGYDFSAERHQEPEFQDADQDETTMTLEAGWKPMKNLGFRYDFERTRTEFISERLEAKGEGDTAGSGEPEEEEDGEIVPLATAQPADEEAWRDTETIALDWLLPIIKRPSLTYSLGLEKEDTTEEQGTWEPTHTLTLDDTWDIKTPQAALSISVLAAYNYEVNPEENDISFTYGLRLVHDLSGTANHSLLLSREPVDTFASTADTDTTTVHYNFTKRDLFIYNLTLSLDIEWERNEPLGEEQAVTIVEEESVLVIPAAQDQVETIWTYAVTLSYSRAVTRKLRRTIEYAFDYEDSSLETEMLDEHRVTLSYIYTF